MNQLIASKKFYVIGVGLWVTALFLGFTKLFIYSSIPGQSAEGPIYWPTRSLIQRNSHLPTLVLFAHSQCPCTKATLGELERLIPKIYKKSEIHVEFFFPKHLLREKSKSVLWKKAKTIPNINVHQDIDGNEAKLFGAETSGQVFLYDSNGILIFQGGITASRGHMGDNIGSSTIQNLILANSQTPSETSIKRTPVFGCSLTTHRGSREPDFETRL